MSVSCISRKGYNHSQSHALRRLLELAEVHASVMQPQDVSNVFWALATSGVSMPTTFVATLSRRAEQVAGEFKPQEISNTL